MPAQRGLRAPLAHVLLGCLDATGTSTEDSTCPVRRPSSGRALRHVGGLANAPQVPSDAGRIGDEREQLHPSAAARAERRRIKPPFTGWRMAGRRGSRHLPGAREPLPRRFGHGTEVASKPRKVAADATRPSRPLAHVLLGSLDAAGTSPKHATVPVRRSTSRGSLRHVRRLADASQVPSDAPRVRDDREQLHPPAAAGARQNVEPKCSLEELGPRAVGASTRPLGHGRRVLRWDHRGLRGETGPELARRREHARVPNGMKARCGHRRRETAEE